MGERGDYTITWELWLSVKTFLFYVNMNAEMVGKRTAKFNSEYFAHNKMIKKE